MRPAWRHCFFVGSARDRRSAASYTQHQLGAVNHHVDVGSDGVNILHVALSRNMSRTYNTVSHILNSSAVFESAFATLSRGFPLVYDVRSRLCSGCDFNALRVLGRESFLVVQVPVTRFACVLLGVEASLPDENRFSRSFLTDRRSPHGRVWASLLEC